MGGTLLNVLGLGDGAGGGEGGAGGGMVGRGRKYMNWNYGMAGMYKKTQVADEVSMTPGAFSIELVMR